MKQEIVDHIVKNKLRLKAETAGIKRELKEVLGREESDFHQTIREQYAHKLRGHIIHDLSINLGVDYETSMVELEDINLDDVLA